MRIRTQSRISILLFGMLLVVIAGSVILTAREVDRTDEQEKIANDVARGAGELGYLANDYLIYHETQQLKRWQSRFVSFSEQVSSLRPERPEQQALVRDIQANQRRLKEVFDSFASAAISPSPQQSIPLDPAFLQVSWSRMAVQSQGLVSDASRLAHLLRAHAGYSKQTNMFFIFAMIGIFGAYFLINYLMIQRRTLTSIAMLQAGTKVVGTGNLDFIIDERKNDEIGDLSRAFNRMTNDLKTVTASKKDLEREIAGREKAQIALRESEQRWATTLASIGDAVMAADTSGRVTFLNPVASALTGWQPEEARGQPILSVFRIINENTREPAGDIVKAVLREGRAVNLANQTVLTARDGREIPVEDSAAPIRDSAGNVTGVVLVFHDVTERRRAQTALRESEHRYRTLFETMNEGFALHGILCDEKGHPCDYRFLEVNPAFERQTGLKGADIVGRTLREVLPQAEAFWVERYGRVALTGEPDHFEQWAEALGRCYDVSAFQAGPGRFAVVFLDITERKRAEESIQQRTLELQQLTATLEHRVAEQTAEIRQTYDAVKIERQRLYDVLETLPAYVALLTPDYHIPFANRTFRERFGESRGNRCFEFLFGRAEACEVCESDKVLRTKAPHQWEWTGPDARLYDVYDFPFTDTDGSPLIMEMGIDVTDRKRAEDALKEANQKLRAEVAARLRLVAAVEQAGEGVAITSQEGVIDYVNPAFERVSGTSRQEILGKKYEEFLADKDLQERIRDSMVREETWSGRVSRKSDGQSFELDVTFSPVRDPSGTVTSRLAVERDVTQEVRLEQHLRQMQKVEALGTLAGGIAHDFNNILNPIFINTELVLLDAPDDSPLRQPLQLVLEAAERGKGLVKQIITFSRQKEHEAKAVKAAPLVKEALRFLRASLSSMVEIREKFQRETGFILADPTQVHQVVMNLCSNAAHAMREKGGVLEVSLAEVEVDEDLARCHPDLKPGPYLRLTISDTGVGMTKEVMERAFDPFFTTKRPGEGSGMGLAVVHGIVRNGKGAITVYSEVGKGSTFNIFFPRVEAAPSSSKVSREPVFRGRERILLVDDEEVQIQSIRNMLERLGYGVVAMTDSVEALSLFRKDPQAFDLVITDQTMPQMTGVRLAGELLRIHPGLPVILCTGFSEAIDANGAQAAGICQFLMKPFSMRDMSEAIRRALEKK